MESRTALAVLLLAASILTLRHDRVSRVVPSCRIHGDSDDSGDSRGASRRINLHARRSLAYLDFATIRAPFDVEHGSRADRLDRELQAVFRRAPFAFYRCLESSDFL